MLYTVHTVCSIYPKQRQHSKTAFQRKIVKKVAFKRFLVLKSVFKPCPRQKLNRNSKILWFLLCPAQHQFCPFCGFKWKWEKSKMMSKLKQINSCVDLDNLYIILLSFFSFTLFVNISLLCYCGSFGDVWTW